MTAPYPLAFALPCPAGCDRRAALTCWLRHARELRGDLAAAVATGNDHDAEVLAFDLRNAERRIDYLLALGMTEAASR